MRPSPRSATPELSLYVSFPSTWSVASAVAYTYRSDKFGMILTLGAGRSVKPSARPRTVARSYLEIGVVRSGARSRARNGAELSARANCSLQADLGKYVVRGVVVAIEVRTRDANVAEHAVLLAGNERRRIGGVVPKHRSSTKANRNGRERHRAETRLRARRGGKCDSNHRDQRESTHLDSERAGVGRAADTGGDSVRSCSRVQCGLRPTGAATEHNVRRRTYENSVNSGSDVTAGSLLR